MNNCGNCKFWKRDFEKDYEIRAVNLDPHKTYEGYNSEDEEIKDGYERVKKCTSPNILFYERPNKDQAAVFDGSEYKAYLYTGEDFGCSLFENIDK